MSRSFTTYESNVLFALRFMIDHEVVGGNWVELPAGQHNYQGPANSNKLSHCQMEAHIHCSKVISHKPEGRPSFWLVSATDNLLPFFCCIGCYLACRVCPVHCLPWCVYCIIICLISTQKVRWQQQLLVLAAKSSVTNLKVGQAFGLCLPQTISCHSSAALGVTWHAEYAQFIAFPGVCIALSHA